MEGTSSPQGSTTTAAAAPSVVSVGSVMAAVGRLLLDFAVQLRDDVNDGVANPAASGWHSPSTEGSAALVDETATTVEGDDAPQLTEEDVAECRARLQRLQRLYRLLLLHSGGGTAGGRGREDAASSCGPDGSVDVDDSTGAARRNIALTTVLGRLSRMSRQFQGLSTASTAALTGVTSSIQPLLSPVSLSDGALAAFSRNVGVVFRRRPTSVPPPLLAAQDRALTSKRQRDGEEGGEEKGGPESHNFWERLSAQQRKARFSLYTLRSAVLPQVDRTCAPLYVSPAVRELAQLNLAAERAMLDRVWCVSTKAHLLRELPTVEQDVDMLYQTLRDAFKGFPPAQQDALLRDIRYVEFLATDCGVVRVRMQHALYLDLTYDRTRGHWVVLVIHWNLFTSAAGATLISALLAPLTSSTQRQLPHGSSPEQLLPENPDALAAYIRNSLQQDGLSGGLQAANRLLCAALLDALALQLQRLQKTFFTGDVARLLEVEVRPGTFVSFRLTPAELPGGDDTALHVKLAVIGGTVVMERVRGTELSTRAVTLLLGASSCVASPLAESTGVHGGCPPWIVVDMEALLWQTLAGEV